MALNENDWQPTTDRSLYANVQNEAQAFAKIALDIERLFSKGGALQEQFLKLNNIVSDGGETIDDLQKQITALQSSLTSLSNSFAALQSDNGQFKANITAQIAAFQSTLDAFQGNLTAIQKQVSQNSSDILALKQAYDPILWKEMTDAFNNLTSTICTAIQNYDATTVQPALSKLRLELAELGADTATDISNLALDIEENAQTLKRAIFDFGKMATDLQSAINSEATDRKAAQERNYQRIVAERNRAITKETAIEGEIVALSETVSDNKDSLNKAIGANKALITAEVERAKGEERILTNEIKDNSDSIKAENSRAQTAESNLQNNLNAETNARIEADKDLNQRCDDIKQTAQNAVTTATGAVSTATDAVNTANQTEANAKEIASELVTMQKEIDGNVSSIADVRSKLAPKPLTSDYLNKADISQSLVYFPNSQNNVTAQALIENFQQAQNQINQNQNNIENLAQLPITRGYTKNGTGTTLEVDFSGDFSQIDAIVFNDVGSQNFGYWCSDWSNPAKITINVAGSGVGAETKWGCAVIVCGQAAQQ